MLRKEYDVFIAYHGSYDTKGSIKIAEKLYNCLIELGYSVFFFPQMQGDAYKANIIDVMKSKTFILVCNENIHRTEDGRLNRAEHYELSTEIDAFYALTQTNEDVSVQDSKILMCGSSNLGQEELIHELFANRPHFHIGKKQVKFDKICEWLRERIPRTKELEDLICQCSGKFFERTYFENNYDSVDRLLMKIDNEHIVKKISMCCYTAGAVLNTGSVIWEKVKSAEKFENAIEVLLREEPTFCLELTITNPNSKAAFEAISNNKIGNKNKHTFYDTYKKVYNCMHNENNTNLINIFSERWEDGFFCKVTDVSLPYAIMHVEYKTGFESLNHIKIDLYSPYLKRNSNTSRLTMLLSQRFNRESYDFFVQQINSINNNARDFRETDIQKEGIYIHKSIDIENALHQNYRQYLTGNILFGRSNLKNNISYLETGISYYREFVVDKPHYHETTAEHYIILEGEQKIIDLEQKSQYIAEKGDFVFLPPWTKHITKNKPGTKIFFAKAPDKVDKQLLKIDLDEWESSYENDF